jgi:hypothetical protein
MQEGQDLEGLKKADFFGYSLAISETGHRIAVGALKTDYEGKNSGSASVFELLKGNWTQVCLLVVVSLQISVQVLINFISFLSVSQTTDWTNFKWKKGIRRGRLECCIERKRRSCCCVRRLQ